MFREEVKNRKTKSKKVKNKYRDRFGKQRKNRIVEKDSIEKYKEGIDELSEK